MITEEVENLREKLKDRVISAVAKDIGVHYMTLYYFKNGSMPSLRLLIALENYFVKKGELTNV